MGWRMFLDVRRESYVLIESGSVGQFRLACWSFVDFRLKKKTQKQFVGADFPEVLKPHQKTSALKPILSEAVSCQQLPHQAAIAKFTYHDTSHTSVSMVGPFWCRDVFVGLPMGCNPRVPVFVFLQKMLIMHNTCTYIYIFIQYI